jgi:hypothetical protein
VILSNGFESNSTTILFTGSIYSPSISKTTTHYVEQVQGLIFSVRCQCFSLFCPAIGEFVCFAYGCRICEGYIHKSCTKLSRQLCHGILTV